MKILISNDDGIHAKGLRSLVNVLKTRADLTIVAPDSEKSGFGHSITTKHPISIKEMDHFDTDIKAYSVNGTPADCVKLALEVLLDEQPDLIVTGVNHGANVGQDLYYSGTIGAAREGVLHGLPAIAVSATRDNQQNIDFQSLEMRLSQILSQLIDQEIPRGVIVNLNMPYQLKDDYQGMKFLPIDLEARKFEYIEYSNPKGQLTYWLKAKSMNHMDLEHTDSYWVSQGYSVISPIPVFLQAKNLLNTMQQWFS